MPVQRVYLSTAASSASQSFSISNPFGLTVSWTYPALTGVSWSTTNTGITLTAAQGTTLATTTVTITASYSTFSYPYIFSLNINSSLLQNPGDVILYTLLNSTLTLKLNSGIYDKVSWTYPTTFPGVSWTSTNRDITLTALQGYYLATTSVTITAIINGTSSYSSTFNLTINNSFTFTKLNGSTSTAPTSLSNYSSYPSNLSLISGIQYWTVPVTTTYNFTAAGAGGTSGYDEQGAVLSGTYTLTKDTILAICVGQMGVQVNGRMGSGGTFVTSVQSINTTSLATAVPLFIAGGAGGVGINGGLGPSNATISTIGANSYGAAGGIGPASGGDSTAPGGGGFTYFKNYGGSKGGGFGLGGNYGVSGYGGGGGGYGGGGGGGGSYGTGGGGGGLYDINYLYNCSVTNSGEGYMIIDNNIRFSLSNAVSIFIFTNSSVIIPITYTTPNPYRMVPVYTSSPSIPGISLTSSSSGVSISAAQGTALDNTSFTVTPTLSTYSNPITIKLSCGTDNYLYIIPRTLTFYVAYTNPYINIPINNPYNIYLSWSFTPNLNESETSTTNTNMRITYYGNQFTPKNCTVSVSSLSYIYSQQFILQTNSTKLTLSPISGGSSGNRLSGVYAYNTSDSYLAFDTRGTGAGVFSNNILYASPGNTITITFNIVYIAGGYPSHRSVWLHDGTSWAYNVFSETTASVGVTPASGQDFTSTFTMPIIPSGLYSMVCMNSSYGQFSPTYTYDSTRTYCEYALAINDYSPDYVLSNPGTTTINTVNGQQSFTLTLTNPLNLIPKWTYPTITGVNWTPSNTGITAVAAQGTSYATNTITVQASFSTFNYPQSFSLSIYNTPEFVLSNPGTTTLFTLISSSSPLVLTLTNPFNLTPTWSYPTITGVTWTPSNTGITAVAAQGSSYATNPITVQASYSIFNYPQSFSLTIDNTPGFVLSNPGPTTLYTLNGQIILRLTLTNSLNLTPTWSYPTITGVTWAPSNTGITLTAAQGSSYATNPIIVQASYSTFNYPQSFSLTIDATTKYTNGIVSTLGSGFNVPYGVTSDQTNTLYIADSNNSLIKQMNATTAAVTNIASLSVWAVAYDGSTYLYGTDNNNHVIYRINVSTGAYTTFAGTYGTTGSADGTGTAASFYQPTGITYNSAGFLYVTDTNNYTIRRISVPGAVVTTLAGSAGNAGWIDATGTAAKFYLPFDLIYDGTSMLYVADSYTHSIRSIVVSTAVVTTLAGNGAAGSNDGTGTAASFNTPFGITYDGTSKLFVSDSGNNTIRSVVISTKVVTTLAGSAGSAGYTDATGSAARFNNPNGITCNKNKGILYVADSFNSAIRKII
jgi:hypothetical protein